MRVGNADGFELGRTDGFELGRAVGETEGKLLGDFEGCAVGLLEGKPVGRLEGHTLGDFEGFDDGSFEGLALGTVDGNASKRTEFMRKVRIKVFFENTKGIHRHVQIHIYQQKSMYFFLVYLAVRSLSSPTSDKTLSLTIEISYYIQF